MDKILYDYLKIKDMLLGLKNEDVIFTVHGEKIVNHIIQIGEELESMNEYIKKLQRIITQEYKKMDELNGQNEDYINEKKREVLSTISKVENNLRIGYDMVKIFTSHNDYY